MMKQQTQYSGKTTRKKSYVNCIDNLFYNCLLSYKK